MRRAPVASLPHVTQSEANQDIFDRTFAIRLFIGTRREALALRAACAGGCDQQLQTLAEWTEDGSANTAHFGPCCAQPRIRPAAAAVPPIAFTDHAASRSPAVCDACFRISPLPASPA